ncbi:MAG: TonB-dependent receptor [Bacteroidetes bacterium]|nr:TonB-dependent receptor [Bacteroidota bacterium]
MIKRSTVLFILFFCTRLVSIAQTSEVTGVLTDEYKTPLSGVKVYIPEINVSAVTDKSGVFNFKNVPYGVYSLESDDEQFDYFLRGVKIDQPAMNLKSLSFLKSAKGKTDNDNIPTVTLSDDDLKESATGHVSSSLSSSRDAFTSATTYAFSIARFRVRGYESGNEITLMNASPMTDLINGRTMFNTWSGLNDVMRSRESSMGLAPAAFSFGGIGGSSIIDSRASHQRKQLQVSYSASNRAYDNRLMATYGSGLLSGGWSYSFSYSRRWADEGYIPGTFYDGHSYFASVEKAINSKHSLSLTAFGAATKNGRSGAATMEMYDLANSHYYNPDWGYQNGKKRNAVVGDSHQPTFILTHEWTINEKSSLESAVSFMTGKSKVSGLDWYNATDPRPDYYRNLPSYVLSSTSDTVLYHQAFALYSSNESMRQINWDHLYEVNRNTGDTAKYVLSNRVKDDRIINLNTFYHNTITDIITVYGGLTYQSQSSEYYKELKDLLGGKYFVNLNQFADQTVAGNNQNDLNKPNEHVYVGDRYGYDYVANISQVSAWEQTVLKFNKVDAFYAVQLSNTSYNRDGKVKNGVFSDNSYGESVTKRFFNYAVKGGLTYKINGRNYVFFNGTMMTRAPFFENAFISPSTQNAYVNGLQEEQISSMEYGYLFKSPKFKARAVGYLTEFKDGTDAFHFYDDDFKTFVNYSIQHIDKRHVGVELAAEAALGQGFSASAVAAVGQFFYTDRQTATITQDNKDTLLANNETVYANNLHVGGTPENAYTIGVSYRSKHFWFVNINGNYFDNIYIQANPARRTLSGIDQVNDNTPLRNQVLSQQQVAGQFTLDVSAGWSWKLNNKIKALKRNTFLVLNVGVNNLLDNTSFVTNGYEQLRFDFQEKNVNKFAPKYYYAFGATYFVNVTLRMN